MIIYTVTEKETDQQTGEQRVRPLGAWKTKKGATDWAVECAEKQAELTGGEAYAKRIHNGTLVYADAAGTVERTRFEINCIMLVED